MISKKLFDRIIREIKRNDHCINDEQVEFFRGIGMYEDLLRIHKESIGEIGMGGYELTRFNRFVKIIKEREKEIFYDCPL